MKIQDFSLKVKLGAIFTIALLLNFIGFFIMLQFLDDHKYDSFLINLAGSQRMLTIQIVNEAHLIADDNSFDKTKLQGSAKLFEENQENLIFGNKKSNTPGIKEQTISYQLLQVLNEWQSFSKRVNMLLKEKDPDKMKELAKLIQKDSNKLLSKVDSITTLIEHNSERKVTAIKNIQISIMVVNFLIFLFAIWASINHVINPITEVIELMKKVADGNVQVKKLKVQRNDEVGSLAQSFNIMVSNLKHLVLTGKVQADFLPPEMTNEKFEIKTIYKPSEYVSGDFFHYIWDKEVNLLYGYLIDIMGHGLDTALHTSHLHVLFEQAAHKQNMSLVEKVQWVNIESIKYLANGTFAAGICFEFDFNSNTLTYVSCGINHFLINTKQQHGIITVEGGFLGIFEKMQFEEQVLRFQPDDYFLFLTDGLMDHLIEHQLPPSDSFHDAFKMIETLSNQNFIKDDASALCINII